MTYPELLGTLGIDYITSGDTHSRPGWIQLCCPFCDNGDRKWHLGYNLTHHYLNCWKCGPKRPAEVVAEATGMPLVKAIQLVKNIRGEEQSQAPPIRRGELVKPKDIQLLSRLSIAKKYLRKRGFRPQELARIWNVQAIGLSDPKWTWRLYIPILRYGEEVSFTTRSFSDKVLPKYRSASPEEEVFPHKDTLYGMDYVKHSVVICEGPVDVWRVGPGAVATFGTAISTAQLLLLSQYPYRYVCFDNEPKAQEMGQRLANDLCAFPGETVNLTLDSADPGSAPPKEIDMLRRYTKLDF